MASQKSTKSCTPTPTNSQYNKALLQNGKFHDCTITCGPRSWNLHRAVLAPRCHFFNICFNGKFSESRTNTICMDDDDPIALEGLLYYLYTLEYPRELYDQLLGRHGDHASDSGIDDDDNDETIGSSEIFWNFNFALYQIADKYSIVELVNLSQKSLLATAEAACRTPAGTKTQSVNSAFLDTLPGYITLINSLYSTGATADVVCLREKLVTVTAETAMPHIRDCRLSSLIASVPEFALDLMEGLSRSRSRNSQVLQESQEQQEQAQKHEFERRQAEPRMNYVPMNEDSDYED